MPRTAPTVNGTPTFKQLSLSFIDESKDKNSYALKIPATATDAEIEALVVAIGAASNANLYRATIKHVYNANAAATAATTGERSSSVYDHVVIQYSEPAGESERGYVPAPLEAIFQSSTGDNPDSISTELAAVIAAYGALVAPKTLIGVRYTENSEVNEQVL